MIDKAANARRAGQLERAKAWDEAAELLQAEKRKAFKSAGIEVAA